MVTTMFLQEAPGVEYLILSYPNYVPVASIPIENGSTHDKVTDIAHSYPLLV